MVFQYLSVLLYWLDFFNYSAKIGTAERLFPHQKLEIYLFKKYHEYLMN